MKNLFQIVPIALITLFLFSCGSETKKEVKLENKKEVVVEKTKEKVISKEVIKEIKITKEDSYSECYITEFIYQEGKAYIVVDYVDRKELDVEEHGEGAFEIVNNNPKLRIFFAKEETYLTCGQNKSRTVKELEAKFKANPKELFTVKVVNGELEMFYIDTCSG